MIRSLLAHVLACASFALAPPAVSALSVVPDPFSLEPIFGGDSTFRATLHSVEVTVGLPTGGSVLAGSVLPGDVSVVFEITIDAGSNEAAVLIVLGHPSLFTQWTGLGAIPGSDADVTGGGIGGYASFGPAAPLTAGTTTDRLFVSAPSVSVGDQFLVSMLGARSTQAGGDVTIVPEPGAGVLLGFGIALLASSGGLAKSARQA